jgi:transposase
MEGGTMADTGSEATSAHTENRMSAGAERIELITRGERRRAWTIEQKREIAAASLTPGMVMAALAREHGIGTGLLYTWRKQLLAGELGEVKSLVPSFLRGDLAQTPTPCSNDGGTGACRVVDRAEPRQASGLIEITLRDGTGIRVDAAVDGDALRRVLAALGRG